MSGAEVFTMEPEQVHRAVEVLFAVEAEVDRYPGRTTENASARPGW